MLRLRPRQPSWATVCHLTGFLLGAGSLIVWPITGKHPDPGVMTFAGALLVFPQAVRAQSKRNEREDRP